MPEELASEAGAPGIARTKVRKRDSCSPLIGLSGSSDDHEMAHQQREPQAAQAAALVDQHLRLLRAEAQAMHAGVDVDHRIERPVVALRGARARH